MEFAGLAAELQILEEGSALIFRSVPRRRWVDLFVPLVFIVGALAGGHWFYYIFGLAVLVGWFIYWARQTPDELWVTDTQLVSSKSGSINWREISRLGYERGGEDDPSGLYADRPWGQVCLLPQLDEEQTGRVMDAIYLRFPNLPMAEATEQWSLFGRGDDLLSLGLSGSKD